VTSVTALARVAPLLRCPTCTEPLRLDGRNLRCPTGHAFDVARQGYVNLLTGRGGAGTGDTPAMVAARDAVLSGGLLDPVVRAVTSAAGAGGGLVLDLAGGTAHYLADVLTADDAALGICLDASAAALRRAARAHPRAAAVGADAWGMLPLASGSVTCVLSVFGPRNADELARVLTDAGQVVVAAPAAEHLAELVEPLGMVRVDPRKGERQASTFRGFTVAARERVAYRQVLDHDRIAALVGMGPTASHLDPTVLATRIAALPAQVDVGLAVDVTVYRR
jgi:23S rRNA (guanine745-N1)-methyltransferase